MASNPGLLTEEKPEILTLATQREDLLSSPPKSATSLPSPKAQVGGEVTTTGASPKHMPPPPSLHIHPPSLGYMRVKKNGTGSKGSWGNLLDTKAKSHIDRDELDYDSGEEPYQLVSSTISDPPDGYQKAIITIVEEYFGSGDVEVAATGLRELGSSEFHPYFINRLVSTAMNRHINDKEMAPLLLSALYADVLSPNAIRDGVVLLLESADNLSMDISDAVNILALFVACAVVDDILPSAFIKRAKKTFPQDSKGFQVLETAEKTFLSTPFLAELVERRWGGSTCITVEKVKKKISNLLQEYMENGDTIKACRYIKELGVPFFLHEVVKRALVIAMEVRAAEPLAFKLLKEAAGEGVLSPSQVAKGFARLEERLDEVDVEIPYGKTMFRTLVRKAISEGLLDNTFMKPSGEDERLREYKKEIVVIIHEYFLSDDTIEVIRNLEELGAPKFNPIFLKKLITLAMDRKNREKEMASALLSALHIEIFSTEDIIDGFFMLLESAEDTALDVLHASDELALFLARAVIDDVLAPLDLKEIGNALPLKGRWTETLRMARSLVAAPHASERLLRCWGGGSGWAVEDAKDNIKKLLEEYESGGVVGEACQCIRDLGMPFFHHEVVKKALIMAMERKNDRMLDLLQVCFCEGLITINQMTKGFMRVKDDLNDLALDVPYAREKFSFYVQNAKNRGWLAASFESSATDASSTATPAF